MPILNWPATALPFERDEGEYLWAATIASRGGIPYRDVFLQKPPGIILVYRALLGITDGSAQKIHILLLCLYVLTALGIGAIALKLTDRVAIAVVSIAIYALSISTPLYQASAANTESFMVAAIVAGFFCLVKARETQLLKWVVLLGIALGIAGMLKQTAAPHIFWLLPGLAFSASARKDRWRWPLIATLAAAIVVLIVCLPYFLAGAGHQLLDGVIWHNLEYSGARLESAYYDRIHVSMLDVATFHVAVWLASLIGIGMLIARRQQWVLAMLGGWALTAWIGVSAGAFYRGHYFLQLLPPVTILAAIAIVTAPKRIRFFSGPILIFYWVISNGFQWNRDPVQLAEQRYHTHFFKDAVNVGRWLAGRSDRSLYILGSEPEIYFYADATPVTRYVIKNPLFGGFASSPGRQRETWAGVQRAPPKWIVTIYPPESIPFFPGADPWLIDRVRELLSARYTPRAATLRRGIALLPIAQIPNPVEREMTIWERNDDTPR